MRLRGGPAKWYKHAAAISADFSVCLYNETGVLAVSPVPN